jgi:hypothetical protein
MTWSKPVLERSLIPSAPSSEAKQQPGAAQRPKEKTMSDTLSAQHPAVVLRSAYLHLRALLAAAAIALVGLTVAVVVLAINTSGSTTLSPVAHANSPAVRANAPTAVGPNPDQRVLQPSLTQAVPTSNYPGRF